MLLKVLFLGCKKALFLHSKWDISPLKEAKTSLNRDQKTVPDFFCCCLFVFKERNNKQTKQKECWKRQCKIKMYLNDLLIIGTPRGIHLFIYSSFANIGEQAETRLFQPSLSFAASFICLPVLKSNTYLSLFYGNLQGFCCVSLLELASSSHGCREDQYERLISLEDWIILFRKKYEGNESCMLGILLIVTKMVSRCWKEWWMCNEHSSVLYIYHWYKDNCPKHTSDIQEGIVSSPNCLRFDIE